MTENFVSDYIDEKIKENEGFIVCTYFDVIVQHNLSKDKEQRFIDEAKIKLESLNYKVFLKNEEYTYKFIKKKVKENELLVAIKNDKGVNVK